MLGRLIRRYPFFSSSLALHAGLLLLLLLIGSYQLSQTEGRRTQAQVDASVSEAQQSHVRRRVGDLKKMKELMERIASAQQHAAQDAVQEVAPPSEAPAPEQSREQMLLQAKQLADRMRELDMQARVEQVKKIFQLSTQEALARVKQSAAPEVKLPDLKTATDEQVLETLEQLTQQSRQALQRQQQALERKQNGSPVELQARDEMRHQAADLMDKDGGNATGGEPGAAAQQGAGPHAGKDDPAGGGAVHEAGQAAGADGAHGGGAGGGPGSLAGLSTKLREMPGNSTTQRAHIGTLAPLAIDSAHMVKGFGRVFGDDAPYANRIYLNSWYVIGPFDAPDPAALHKRYPPESLVDLDAVYFGKGGRVLRWTYVDEKSYPLVPPDPSENAVYYGYTELRLDRATDVWMAFGSDDDAKVWVNGRLVWVGGPEAKAWYTQGGYQSLTEQIRAWNLSEGRRRVRLQSGRNKLMFKLYNNPTNIFFSMVLETDSKP